MQIQPDEATLVALTPQWSGERDDHGRPRVSDAVIERLRGISTEQAWKPMKHAGYERQFVGGWCQTRPGQALIGRAVTAQYVPHRPDFDAVAITAAGERGWAVDGVVKQNWWAVEAVSAGDVMVVDMFGKIEQGTFIGDNLATALASRTDGGAVIDGGIRDETGIAELESVNVFHRGAHPTGIADVTMAGLNIPVRVGGVTVLPGDVVIGTPTGVIFVPPHLAEHVAEHAENTRLRDLFGKSRLAERVYTSDQIDVGQWDADIEADFDSWRLARR